MTEDRKKYNSQEKMKRKKSCNDAPSIGPSSKKKCNHLLSTDPTVDPTSTNPVDLTIDPTSTNPVDPTNTSNSSNPIPNRASTPNLICNEGISFFNDNCKHRYDNCFYNRPLLLERGVLLDQLKDVGCDAIFAFHQWNSAVDIKKTDKAYNTLVKIFYSNMHDIDKVDHKFKSFVRKISFEVIPDLVSKILGVRRPFVPNDTLTYPFNNSKHIPKLEDVYAEIEGIPNNFSESVDNPVFFQQDLTPKYRMLNLIVGYNIRPRGHNADFGLDRAHLLYSIGKGICIDLPCLIVDEIISVQCTKDRRRYLSFPILISKLMEDCGVVIHSSDASSTPMNPIYGGTIKKSLGQGKKKKTQQTQEPQVEIQNEVVAEDNIAAQDVPNSSTGGPLDDPPLSVFKHLLIRMDRKIEEFENTQNEIKESLKVIDSRLNRIDNRWDRIKVAFAEVRPDPPIVNEAISGPPEFRQQEIEARLTRLEVNQASIKQAMREESTTMYTELNSMKNFIQELSDRLDQFSNKSKEKVFLVDSEEDEDVEYSYPPPSEGGYPHIKTLQDFHKRNLWVYIMNNKLPLAEELVWFDKNHIFLKRSDLQSLGEKEWVHDSVINALPLIMSDDEKFDNITNKERWYLPTWFSQQAVAIELSENGLLNDKFRSNYDHFIHDINKCDKIYVPMNDGDIHWYLIVVDVQNKEVMILDTLRNPSKKHHRFTQAVKTVNVLHRLITDLSEEVTPIDKWPIITPRWVPIQSNSYDCGMYIIEMIRAPYLGQKFPIREPSIEMRMELAISLVTHLANKNRDKTMFRASVLG